MPMGLMTMEFIHGMISELKRLRTLKNSGGLKRLENDGFLYGFHMISWDRNGI
jgi:hypothetical protein